VGSAARGSAPRSALTLAGREFGLIELMDKLDGAFTQVDEAVLVHLAQMAAAALERARLYRR
jgi:GAF domain-containing protein